MFGEHAAYIIPSYLVTFLSLGALTVWILRVYAARKAELEKLEESSGQAET